MNRGLIRARMAILAILCALAAAGAAAQEFKYIRSTSVAAQNRVLVKTVTDFLDLAKVAKVDTVYALDPSGERIEEFYAWTNGLFIALRANNYQTLADFAAGMKIGFLNGVEYYASREIGTANKDEYDYWMSERYLSVKDMKAAMSAGYRGKGKDRDSYVFPRKVTERLFEAGCLDALVFASLMEGVTIPLNQSSRELSLKYGFKLPSVGSSLSIGAKGSDRERFNAGFQFLREYWTKEQRLGKIDYRKIEGAWVSAAVPSFSGTGGDASLWYFSRAFGELKLADFLDRYTILASGYDSKQDEAIALRSGFPLADDYYAALAGGFDNFRDFGGARVLTVPDAKSWAAYRDRLKDLSDAMARLGVWSWPEGVVALQLSLVPPGKAIALERLAEAVNAYIDGNKDLKKLLGDKTNASAILALIQSRREVFSRLGELDAEGKNFGRR